MNHAIISKLSIMPLSDDIRDSIHPNQPLNDSPTIADLHDTSLPNVDSPFNIRETSSLDGSSGECPEHRRKRVARQTIQPSNVADSIRSQLQSPVSSSHYASLVKAFAQSNQDKSSPLFNNSFNLPSDVGIVLADASQNITHVNQTFESITGYSRSDSIGRNCNFLQGKATSADAKNSMRAAISRSQTVQLPVLNYRKNGVPFWNLLTIAPMLDPQGYVSHYIGVQVPQAVIYVDRPLDTFPWSNQYEPKSAPIDNDDDDEQPDNYNKLLKAHAPRQLTHAKSMSEIDTYRSRNPITPLIPSIPEERSDSPINEMLLEPPSLTDDLADTTDSDSSLNSTGESDSFVSERRKSIESLRHDVEQLHVSDSPSHHASNSPSLHPLPSSSSHALPPALDQATPVTFVAETLLPTAKGKLRVRAYKDLSALGTAEHREIMVIYHGDLRNATNVPTRVHDACFTSEVLHSLKCDCRQQLDFALEFIQTNPAKCGMVIYMPQEGRGIGLANKIKVYSVQEKGYDTVDANRILGFPDDLREYTAVPSILDEMGVKSIQLMTNNPRKSRVLAALGVNITARIPVIMDTNEHSKSYVAAKRARMGHFAE